VRFSFEDYLLDTDRRELRRGRALLSVEPQVLDLLVFLIRNRDRVVSKDDLLASVWGGRIVSEATISSRINAARRTLGDNGEDQRLIRTIIGKGVRFVAPVREDHAPGERVTPGFPPRLSIVVLPFTNLSNDPDLEYLSDGITDDLTTDCSQIPGSFVIARNTAFTFKGKSVDVKNIGRELGVCYVVEGSLRRAGERVRVNVQLTDTESGAHLWADRFDTDPANLAPVQNEILGRLTRALSRKLMEAAGLRIEQQRTPDTNPQDLLIHGWALFNRATTAAILREAQLVFERVLEMEPGTIGAKIGIGYALVCNVANYWSTSVEQDKARAERLLLEAIEQDANNARARAALGVLRRVQNRLDESRIEFETAIALAPNYAAAFWMLGTTLILLGRPDAAILVGEKGLQLSSSGEAVPIGYMTMGQAHLLLGHVEQAIEFARKARASNPRLYFTHTLLAAALGLKGDLDEARAALAEAIKLRPEFSSLARWRAYMTWGSPEYWALRERTTIVGLRRAGMPDE
jgi:TolB-like protein/Flp pilus assembly protein TadD